MDSGRPVNESSRLEESLSALMDGQADELELRRILRELPANPELSATWKRYHAVRASLQQEIHSDPTVDLLAGINTRIAAGAEGMTAPRRGFRADSVLRYLGQGAIAATVAVAALMSVSFFGSGEFGNGAPGSPAGSIAQNIDAETPVLNGNYTESELSRTVATDAEALERLEQAVYQEFSGTPQTGEIPLSYTIDGSEFPVQPASAE